LLKALDVLVDAAQLTRDGDVLRAGLDALAAGDTTEYGECENRRPYPHRPYGRRRRQGPHAGDYDGRTGIVAHIDSLGQLHGSWGGLAVIPGADEYEITPLN
jgi:hypothetical protein